MGADFMPTPGADGWQLSNPPILGLAPLRGSLELFDRAGMAALREKSERLTGYLETLIRDRLSDTLQIATPREPERRRSEEHTSELQSLMRISYAVFCLKKKRH